MKIKRDKILKKGALFIISIFGLMSIIASGGGSSSSVSGGTGQSGGSGNTTPPTVTIASPADAASYNSGSYVNFTGTAKDASGNTISDANLIWTSSIDKRLGTGNSLELVPLSDGSHVITFTATDSDGNAASASITISMQEQSNTSPVIAITKPADASTFNSGDLILLEGSGTDAEDGSLPANKLTWYSSIDKQLGTGATREEPNLSGGKHTITLIGEDKSGAKSSASVTITIQNTRPTATITYPPTGSTYTAGQYVLFNGHGTDSEDGDLADKSLVWTSSLQGEFGEGTSTSTTNLLQGTHKITLTATDKNGAVDTAEISITIN
jgi:hypothetical protein